MKRKLFSRSLALLAAAVLWPAATGFGATQLGDPAPALKIEEWIKGDPVNLSEGKGKKIYVIEFWATWCPPCRTSIPHLTELQQQYKDKGVVIIGVSDEKSATVKKFVRQMGDKMDYTVALDEDRKTSQAYMQAFKQGGIPHAFVVDKEGRIVWHGHPMGGLDDTLKQLVSGKFDLETAKKRNRAQAMFQEFTELAAEGENKERLDELGKELTQLDAEIGGINPGQKFDPDKVRQQAQFQGALRSYQQALAQEQSADEIAKLEETVRQSAPEEFNFDDFKRDFTFQRTFMQYYQAATGRGEGEELPVLAQQLRTGKTQNPMLLNDAAWALLTDEKIKNRDLELAMVLAKGAYDASGGKEANIIDTYARALFDTGQVEAAIREQKRAISLSTDEEQSANLKKALEKYQNKAVK